MSTSSGHRTNDYARARQWAEMFWPRRRGLAGRTSRPWHEAPGFPGEGKEDVRAKPPALVGDRAVGEVTPSLKQDKPSFGGRPVQRDVARVDEASNGFSDIRGGEAIAARQDPNQFAERGNSDGDQFGVRERGLSEPALAWVVAHYRPDKYVGVGRDPHRRPAQPSAAISLISSI